MALTTKSTPAADLKPGDRFLGEFRTEHTVRSITSHDEEVLIVTTGDLHLTYFWSHHLMAYTEVPK